jgi:hypothetical protein
MGRVFTNSLALASAREATPGVLPGSPRWQGIEPNTISKFGTTISKVARSPISRTRQRRKGVTTDADSSVEFAADLTLAHLRDYIEGFCFSRLVGPDVYVPTGVTSTGYTVPALSAAQAGRLLYGASAAKTLVFARGWTTAANNGLKPINVAHSTSGTEIKVTGLTAEALGTHNDGEVAIAGVRGAAGDLQIDSGGNLISTVLDFTTLGLTVGQSVHIGGIDILNRFFHVENYGFARIAAIAAHKLTFGKRSNAYLTDDGTDTGAAGAGVSVDILFGQYVRTVPVDHADYLQVNYQFELTSPNLGDAGEDQFEYALGNWADTMSFDIPLTNKATITYGFVGLSTTDPSPSRATNAASSKTPSETAAFSTSADLARLRVQNVDETGLTTDFKSLKLTLSNNVAGEKVLGLVGPKYLNAGNVEVDVETEALFTNRLIPKRIRDNATLGLDFAVRNDEGGALFDLPSGTLDSGNRTYPVNATVLISTKFESFEDPVLGHSFSCSLFPALPPNS